MKHTRERGCILNEALTVINGQRQDEYGNPEDNFGIIADFWNVYLRGRLGKEITQVDVAIMMDLLKTARIKSGTATKDSFVDKCGYTALAFDMLGDPE